MLKAARDNKAKIVFIANPNNPTGTFLSADELQAFLRGLPPEILVVLDEAYNEYLPEDKRYDSVTWLKEFPNLIISRTFSKAYGLAGLRVGYALAHEQVTDMMNRVRQPFNVNSVAQAAAVAALRDVSFVKKTFDLNRRGMQQITDGLTKLGLEYIPVVRQLRGIPHRQCHGDVPTLTRTGRDRAPDSQLRYAGLVAREHRSGK